MARRYRIRQSQDNPFAAVLMVLMLVAISSYLKLPDSQKIYALIGAGILVVLIVALIALFIVKRREIEQKRLHALEISAIDTMTGLEFEKYIALILKSHGYQSVSLTEYYDYGEDIIAEKDGVRWGIQTKRYAGLVKAEAVRQVVTALNKYKCQKSMVVTNSIYSKPAKELARTNDCILIDREELVNWIVDFQEMN